MKQVQSVFQLFALMCVALVLAACSSVPAVDTFNKQLAAGYTTVDAIAQSTSAALAADKITQADAATVVTTARGALSALDVASQMHATNPAGAADKLQATLAVLTALQGYLATKGAK
jgi:hypothetical protein